MEDEKTISEIKELSKLKTFFIPKYQRKQLVNPVLQGL